MVSRDLGKRQAITGKAHLSHAQKVDFRQRKTFPHHSHTFISKCRPVPQVTSCSIWRKVFRPDAFEAFLCDGNFAKTIFYLGENRYSSANNEMHFLVQQSRSFLRWVWHKSKVIYMAMDQYMKSIKQSPLQSVASTALSAMAVEYEWLYSFLHQQMQKQCWRNTRPQHKSAHKGEFFLWRTYGKTSYSQWLGSKSGTMSR